ncbi:MAG TPA: acylneuraminate cytidylyltransferase family protein [Jatrophihabitans sp.]|nr:acylneuraminate cytidylyltransferase family protein [Jatrophihabitans sp.]
MADRSGAGVRGVRNGRLGKVKVLGIVPARGGSKGLPGKNIRPLAGVPLLGHSLRAAGLVPAITRCVVTTDAEQIADVARSLGADVPFVRPAELAADDTPMAPVLRHALAQVEAEEATPYDYVVLLDPTSPVREPADVTAALGQLAERPDWDGVVSVSAPTFHPVWVGVRGAPNDPATLQRYFADGVGVTRRQQLGRYLRVNGNFYVWRAAFVRRLQSSWMDEGVHGIFEIPESRAFSIDDAYEFALVEALVTQGFLTLPGAERRSH